LQRPVSTSLPLLLRRMLAAGGSSIVNIGSPAGVTALGRGHIAYSLPIGAVVQMTRELSIEWARAAQAA
jgi:NAD(P)-dependent dehydrogenase (short-subunit alcohol dehydrogenase family)